MNAARASLLFLLAAACGGQKASSGAAAKPPSWFESCPKGSQALYFCAETSDAKDEKLAKDLAIDKALGQLTLYVGAEVKASDHSKEVEKNGVMEQEVSATVDVAGEELVIKEATVKKIATGQAGDGSYSGFAMIEWPRAQYEAVLQAQRARATRALDVFHAADKAAADNDTIAAKDKLKEAKALLGSSKNPIPLDDKTYPNSALLRTAMTALDERIATAEKERGNVCAVGLLCTRDGGPAACRSSRIGVLREAVSKTGKKVSTEAIPDQVIAAILESGAPKVDAKVRSAGCIIAVRLTSELMEKDGPFTFVRVGARAAVYDTASNRILNTHELPPTKSGHPNYEGAMERGFDSLEKQLAEAISGQLLGAR